ncbi:Gibberellin 3-beta-dioxygenase 4 [Bienertia sinuspersici]
MPTNSPKNSIQEEKETDFRAPPPSPIASSRRASSVANDDVLSEFLEHSLRVPDLILPDRIFPKQKPVGEILAIDLQALNFNGGDLVSKIKDSLSEIGCFQVINHGVSAKLMGTVVRRANRIFRMPPEKKKMAVRSPEMEFGFDEVCGEQDEVCEISEEFVWGKTDGFRLKMEGIWPVKYSKFSAKMETLATRIEKVAKDIMLILNDSFIIPNNVPNGEGHHDDDDDQRHMNDDCVCHIYKHPHDVGADQCISALRYDVIRMMIKGSDYSHALAFHMCDGSSEFHVYSKKGWISFVPLQNSLIVTAGDLIQVIP